MTDYPKATDTVPVVTTKHLVSTAPNANTKYVFPERHYVYFEFNQFVWNLPEDEFLRVMDIELNSGLRDIRQHLMETYAKGRQND